MYKVLDVNEINNNLTLNLFDELNQSLINLLHKDGIVNYYGVVFSARTADACYQALLNNIEWKNDEANIYGKHIITKRKIAWYASQSFNYTYSRTTKKALPWTPLLLKLKEKVEQVTNEKYNSCLLNLYHNGSEGMAWHSDNEKDLQNSGAIGSLTFGAERKFSLKHKTTQETINVLLQHGSILVMKGDTQKHWLHRLPPTIKVSSPRINLTFRTISTQ